jgi:hypothetical protein
LPIVISKLLHKFLRKKADSDGSFCVETFQSLEIDQIKPIALAYNITARGIHLEKKDGLLGKSGMPWIWCCVNYLDHININDFFNKIPSLS